jgi:dolichyl-phosphate-mannose--protein O-mannosyl transferase
LHKENGIVHSVGNYSRWDRPVEKTSILAIIILTIAAFATRFYRIEKGDFVVYHPSSLSHNLDGTRHILANLPPNI